MCALKTQVSSTFSAEAGTPPSQPVDGSRPDAASAAGTGWCWRFGGRGCRVSGSSRRSSWVWPERPGSRPRADGGRSDPRRGRSAASAPPLSAAESESGKTETRSHLKYIYRKWAQILRFYTILIVYKVFFTPKLVHICKFSTTGKSTKNGQLTTFPLPVLVCTSVHKLAGSQTCSSETSDNVIVVSFLYILRKSLFQTQRWFKDVRAMLEQRQMENFLQANVRNF